MDTINISLPSQLKIKADDLINRGYFASFSDLVRTALRQTMRESEYDQLSQEAISDHMKGKSTIMSSAMDVDKYIKKHI